MEDHRVAKPNRRRGQDQGGRKKRAMRVHSRELKYTLPRHIRKKRPNKK